MVDANRQHRARAAILLSPYSHQGARRGKATHPAQSHADTISAHDFIVGAGPVPAPTRLFCDERVAQLYYFANKDIEVLAATAVVGDGASYCVRAVDIRARGHRNTRFL